MLELRHKLPYAEAELFTPERQQALLDDGDFLYFSHTLEDLIGGRLDAGLSLDGLYEDTHGGDDLLSTYMSVYIATRSIERR